MSSQNPNAYSPGPYQQQPARQSSSNGWIVIVIVAVIAVPMMLACLGILVGLMLPAVQAAREAARRMQCTNNEKQIVLALLNYESAHRSFPPAYTVDANGRRLHSWRTLILPYMEQQAVYQQIDLDKPWDDPVNLPFSQLVIPTYSCPSTPTASPELTTYVAVVDPSGIFSGSVPTKLSEILDGTGNTLIITEVDASSAVPWASPEDIDLNGFINPVGAGSAHAGGRNIATADGAVRFYTDAATALVTKDGND